MSEMPTLRSRTLRITYNIPISKTLKFWEGIKEGKIYATKCKKCGKLYFPPVADCSACLSSEMEWVELSGEGELETFTHIIVWLVGVKKKDVKVGMKVKLMAKVTPEGRLTYEFRPIE